MTVKVKTDPAVAEDGTEERARELAVPGFTVRLALFPTATPDTVAPTVMDPELMPVKLEV